MRWMCKIKSVDNFYDYYYIYSIHVRYMKKLIKIFKNKTLQKSIFILSFVFVFSVSEVKTARAEICENILITWACNVVDDVGDAIPNGMSSVFQVVSNISGFLNIEQVTNNILGIVAGTIVGTSSWIAGGNASDGYKQGFCITKNITSGDFLNGGDCPLLMGGK